MRMAAHTAHIMYVLYTKMMEMARCNPELDEIESIFTSIQTASKTISSLVKRAFLTGQTGAQGSINIQGEEQQKLDVICNDVLKNALKWTGKLGTVASEEEDVPVIVDNRGNKVYSNDVLLDNEGGYVAVFDPLDGTLYLIDACTCIEQSLHDIFSQLLQHD